MVLAARGDANKIDGWHVPEASCGSAVGRGGRRRRGGAECREVSVLTEAEVQRSFNLLFRAGERSPEQFDRAEQLLEELRPESPLRLRLSNELEELRRLAAKRSGR